MAGLTPRQTWGTKKMTILNIQDTRQNEEGPNDKWIPIPGSGIENECQRCGKTHEVHVTVQDGESFFIVGTGCAKKDSMISDKQAQAGNSTAKTIAKWQAQISALTPLAATWDSIYKEELTKYLTSDRREGNRTIVDGKVRDLMGIPRTVYNDSFEVVSHIPNPSYQLQQAQKSLARAEKKMAQLIKG